MAGFWRRLGLFAASGTLGAALALGLLVPALLEVEQSKGGLFALDFSLTPNYPLWQLPYRLFFGNFFWSDVTGALPNLYCGTMTRGAGRAVFCRAPCRGGRKPRPPPCWACWRCAAGCAGWT